MHIIELIVDERKSPELLVCLLIDEENINEPIEILIGGPNSYMMGHRGMHENYTLKEILYKCIKFELSEKYDKYKCHFENEQENEILQSIIENLDEEEKNRMKKIQYFKELSNDNNEYIEFIYEYGYNYDYDKYGSFVDNFEEYVYQIIPNFDTKLLHHYAGHAEHILRFRMYDLSTNNSFILK
jgi:hypothetical protein